jgi:hypothetical protein
LFTGGHRRAIDLRKHLWERAERRSERAAFDNSGAHCREHTLYGSIFRLLGDGEQRFFERQRRTHQGRQLPR